MIKLMDEFDELMGYSRGPLRVGSGKTHGSLTGTLLGDSLLEFAGLIHELHKQIYPRYFTRRAVVRHALERSARLT